MAGLACAWALGRDHDVTLFERHSRIGIGAHALDLAGGTVDVPLRVLYPGYYPQLFDLLQQCGVGVEPLNAALSFSQAGGDVYFGYHNTQFLGRSWPWLQPAMWLQSATRQITYDLARFLWHAPQALQRGELLHITIGAYLQAHGYSAAFCDGFLIPCFAGINTASHADVRNYPAELIAQYFSRRFMLSSVYRAVGGATAIADALQERITHFRFNARLQAVQRTARGVSVVHEDGAREPFDALVFATQANQVLPLLQDATPAERKALGGFRYGAVEVVMHHDARLMPARPAQWAPVNYLMAPQHDRPMVSIWVNRLLPSYTDARPVFQTINPQADIDTRLVLQQARFERPVANLRTAGLLRQMDALHAQTDRRVFFCGSYAAHGIPLLESAVVSATQVAHTVINTLLAAGQSPHSVPN